MMNAHMNSNIQQQNTTYDVAVIGGGPSGMMAAVRAAERGRKVLLIEKNKRLGKKLSISGGGRCNVTNNKPVVRDMLDMYKDAGKFLFSTYTQHGVAESIAWFEDKGVQLKEENDGRLFPTTDSAETICQALEVALRDSGVTVKLQSAVRSVVKVTDGFAVTLQDGSVVQSANCVIAAGGLSRPDTGSTGDGFGWLEQLGHAVNDCSLALVPIALQDKFVSRVSGISLPDVKVSLYADGQKQTVSRGKILFTHVGMSGPTILNMSSTIVPLLQHSVVTLRLDLFPDHDDAAVRDLIQGALINSSNQKVRNVLAAMLPKAIGTELLQLAAVDPETPAHSVTKDERRRIIAQCKNVIVTVLHVLGTEKAVISSGGASLAEIDFKTMQSRHVPGLYVIGDMLDVDRPSGGYGLQLSWSTGWVAGNSV